MAQRYSWQESKSEPSYRSPDQDHLWWWAAAAMLVSVLLHVVVFFALDRVRFAMGIDGPKEVVTGPMNISRPIEETPQEYEATPPPEDIPLPPKDTAALVDEIELLDNLKNQEIDLKPQIVDTEIALRVANPAASGTPEGVALEVSAGLDITGDLPTLGTTAEEMRPAAAGQMTVDPGSMKADDSGLTKFTEDILKKGANGKAEKGSLDGLASLDDLIGMKQNQLLGTKTMLPSDLLFEFNKYELRESAKFGLQKLGLLMDNNPTMYCWIEGHTDLIGGDAPNLELSRKRAEAVKEYLVQSMRMPADKIITRGFGRFEPIITSGNADQQSPNRRVEIKMRKTPPTEDQIKISPPKAPAVVEETPPPRATPAPATPAMTEPQPAPEPPKAVMVKPNPQRGIPVEVLPNPEPAPTPKIPKATPVTEEPAAPARALPVPMEPAVPARALPVQEEVQRAVPVAE